MPSSLTDMDAHEAPPLLLKKIFKDYQRISLDRLDIDERILDLNDFTCRAQLQVRRVIPADQLSSTLSEFMNTKIYAEDRAVYYHAALPGLLMVPALLPEEAQRSLLSRMLHRDLSDHRHKTNVHMHHNVIYPSNNNTSHANPGSASSESLSFFSEPPSSDIEFSPVNPKMHKPLSISRFLNKSLRWITLGGQYDWTRKVYPEEEAPRFPHDIGNLIGQLFEEMVPQAAIVNVYSPGDTLSLHRDVSEQVDKGLVSVSIGCDCLFVIGLKDESDTVIVRLRSGDAVYMSKEARFAWHGVPKIIPRTCPPSLESWPAQAANGLNVESPQFESWKGWLSTKRINLNVRQMMESV